MKRIVVDANVLLSYLTDRDQQQQEAAARLLTRRVSMPSFSTRRLATFDNPFARQLERQGLSPYFRSAG